MSEIDAKQEEIVELFEWIEDPLERYETIIEYANKLPELEESLKTDEWLVQGCQSKVWLIPKLEDGKLLFKADSNTRITKGIAALLVDVLSGNTPEAIQNAKLDFIETIKLHEHLSSQRSNGLSAMIQKMKDYAGLFANSSS